MAAATKTAAAKTAAAKAPAPEPQDVTNEKTKAEAPLDTKSIEKDLIAGIRAAVGKLETVDKQAYTRLMHNGVLVGYVRRSKKGILLQLEARVDDPAEVEKAVAVVKQAYDLS